MDEKIRADALQVLWVIFEHQADRAVYEEVAEWKAETAERAVEGLLAEPDQPSRREFLVVPHDQCYQVGVLDKPAYNRRFRSKRGSG